MGDIIIFFFQELVGALLIGMGRRLLRRFGIEAGDVVSLFTALLLVIVMAVALLSLGKLVWSN